MRFTWDPAKNAANVRRHGIAFQDAARIFDGPTVERTDDRYDYGVVRIYAIGLVNGIEITVIYTDRDPDERHIISGIRAQMGPNSPSGGCLYGCAVRAFRTECDEGAVTRYGVL